MKTQKIDVEELLKSSKKNEKGADLRSASELLVQMTKQPIVCLSEFLFKIVCEEEDKNGNSKQ